MTKANGTFELKSFDEDTIEEYDDGTKVTRARIVTTMSGDLDGEATADSVMHYASDGTATIVGFHRFVGSGGTFTAQSTGGFDGTEATADLTILTGTGDYAKLTGTGRTAAPHGPNGTYSFDYARG